MIISLETIHWTLQPVCLREAPSRADSGPRWRQRVGFTQPQVRPVRWQLKTNQLSVRCVVPSRTGSLQFLLLTAASPHSVFYLHSVQEAVEVMGLDHRPTVVQPVQGFKPCIFPLSTYSFCSPNHKMWQILVQHAAPAPINLCWPVCCTLLVKDNPSPTEDWSWCLWSSFQRAFVCFFRLFPLSNILHRWTN